jgi:hypothetical protein
MRCPRCKGIMAQQKFYGLGEFFWGWKCMCCGEIIDPVILENRDESLKPCMAGKGLPGKTMNGKGVAKLPPTIAAN